MANVQTQNRWRRRMAALMLTVMLLVPCMPRALALKTLWILYK